MAKPGPLDEGGIIVAISVDLEGIWDFGPSLTHTQVMADLDALEQRCLVMLRQATCWLEMIAPERVRVAALTPDELATYVFHPANIIRAVRVDSPPLFADDTGH